MNDLEKILKILGDKNRLRILKLLEKKKMCVCELAAVLGITQPSVSRHLRKLKMLNLIGEEQDSLWSNYYLRRPVHIYSQKIMGQIRQWLNDDEVVLTDRRKAGKIHRTKICCPPRSK